MERKPILDADEYARASMTLFELTSRFVDANARREGAPEAFLALISEIVQETMAEARTKIIPLYRDAVREQKETIDESVIHYAAGRIVAYTHLLMLLGASQEEIAQWHKEGSDDD